MFSLTPITHLRMLSFIHSDFKNRMYFNAIWWFVVFLVMSDVLKAFLIQRAITEVQWSSLAFRLKQNKIRPLAPKQRVYPVCAMEIPLVDLKLVREATVRENCTQGLKTS
jgi:hypothetical protein